MKISTTRRNFVKSSSTLSAGAILASPNILKAVSNDKIIKVGLLAIAGRGSGASAQAMNADPNVHKHQ